MKPARSWQITGDLPTDSTNARASFRTASSVTTVLTSSTSPITGAGLKKCTPSTLEGRVVLTAISMTGREEVFVAIMACSGSSGSSAWKASCFSSRCSGIASMTMSHSLRSANVVVPEIRDSVASRSAASILPRSTARSIDCVMRARPAATWSSSSSRKITR